MENILDYYSIFFVVLLGFSIAVFICLLLYRMVKYILKSYQKKERRKARRKMRVLRNEMIKKNKNTNSIL